MSGKFITGHISPLLYFAIVCFSLGFSSCSRNQKEPRILVYTGEAFVKQNSNVTGLRTLMQLGEDEGISIDTTTNGAWFTDDSLKNFAAVVFFGTSGEALDHTQEVAFERFIQAGGGYVGIHAATSSEYGWKWYGRLTGAVYENNPSVKVTELEVVDKSHPATQHLPQKWGLNDEVFLFAKLPEKMNVLLTRNEKGHDAENGIETPNPLAWYHDFDGGRAFYTALGNSRNSFTDTLFLQHILGGIRYAIGENNKLDYNRVKTPPVPEEGRFVKKVLVQGEFYEPMEMAILPNLDVLVVERRGGIKIYKQETGEVKDAGLLDVYASSNTGANVEEGLLGIAADPDFKNNRHVFIFYSPADTSVNRLSRFTLAGDKIDPASEKIVLQFYSQRGICCHTGGSIAFGPDGHLFLSTGDNSTPFNARNQRFVTRGYAPLDDRTGQEAYDARRSASNTNDLRGKIIRIKVHADGSYTIPEGNLFKEGVELTRPEIYTMGNRNPYRISIDQKRGTLYWGDIGPDARVDSMETRGSKGFDEFNQAKKAGNYGWPLFIGENIPYRSYDYGTGKSGSLFDPAVPVNNSRNNTGLQELPPAQPAFIWYPYVKSKKFPQLGEGGRSSMAGPVYYSDQFPKETAYPAYYDGKLFIYEWVRNWIKVITLGDDEQFEKMEPFMASTTLAAPVDMEVGPDGRIYVLEYGNGWFTKNPDAGLSRIDYLKGNIPPKISEFTIDKTSGNLPFTINAKVEVIDPDNDRINFEWTLGNVKKTTSDPWISHTFVRPGDQIVSVAVKNKSDVPIQSEEKTVIAGNQQPEVAIKIQGNKSFYFDGQPVPYAVSVKDSPSEVDMERLFISVDYIEGTDMAGADLGHQEASDELIGKSLMLASDCSACHKIDEKSIGPSFVDIAQKYPRRGPIVRYLNNKIIQGGSGVWGEHVMPAHSQMSVNDASKISNWILSLGEEESKRTSLPPSGTIRMDPARQNIENTVLKLTATYSDAGGEGVRPLSGSASVVLRSNLIEASEVKAYEGFKWADTLGNTFLEFPKVEGWLELGTFDLSGIRALQLELLGSAQADASFQVEVRVGNIEGAIVGKPVMVKGSRKTVSIPLQSSGGEFEKVFVKVQGVEGNEKTLIKGLRFLPEG